LLGEKEIGIRINLYISILCSYTLKERSCKVAFQHFNADNAGNRQTLFKIDKQQNSKATQCEAVATERKNSTVLTSVAITQLLNLSVELLLFTANKFLFKQE
jgi:hypothetical protein